MARQSGTYDDLTRKPGPLHIVSSRRPKLVLDEPTAALAAREVEMTLQLIKDVSARGVSVVLITHRLQDLFEVADRFVVLYEGVNHAELQPEETDLSGLVNAMMGR